MMPRKRWHLLGNPCADQLAQHVKVVVILHSDIVRMDAVVGVIQCRVHGWLPVSMKCRVGDHDALEERLCGQHTAGQ